MSIRETRFGADRLPAANVCPKDANNVELPKSGIYVKVDNANAYIKTLDISSNYLTTKDPGASFVNLDPASGSRLRSTAILGNFFGEALDVNGPNMPAAVLLGADNTLVATNTLQSAREGTTDPGSKVDYFFKASRASLNTVLVGNIAQNPLENGFLDETAFQLSDGRQLVANTGATAPIVRTKRINVGSPFTTNSVANVTPSGFTLSLRANTIYQAMGTFLWSASATAVGAGFGFDVNIATTNFAGSCQTNTNQAGATTPTFYASRVPDQVQAVSSVDTANATMLAQCTATFRTNASGRLSARMRASSAANVTLLPASFIELKELAAP